jgi:peptide deformylase
MVLDIIKYGDINYGRLRLKNIDVKKENPILQSFINDMFDTLDNNPNGVGLAAPQVGKNLNLFIIKTPKFQEVFINPEINLEGLNIQIKETCLSFVDMQFAVDRRSVIKIKYFDRDWVLRLCEFNDALAIIVQHEYDHLKGKLIID